MTDEIGTTRVPSKCRPLPAIICPECAAPVNETSHIPCGHETCPCAIKEGIICVNLTRAHFGEIDPDEMRNILRFARKQGWHQAADKYFTDSRSSVADMIQDERRIAFSKRLSITGTEDVLDIGCGYGGISAQLSRKVRSVTALDITLERVSFLEIIKNEENIPNIQTVCNGDVLRLPFRDDSFDIVIMIGVLEYFPISLSNYSPWDAQTQSLKEIHRILKPGGQLYLATKNRFGWPFLRGVRDHNNIPFGSILPLSLADWISRRIHDRPYRIVSHSYPAYQRLLSGSGFGDSTTYWPIPGYQKPEDLISLHDRHLQKSTVRSYMKNPLKRTVLSLLAHVGLLRYFVPHFSIVAKKMTDPSVAPEETRGPS